MPERRETKNEEYQRVIRELRAIATNPEESTERRVKARNALRQLTQGSHIAPDVRDTRKP